jgi:hypothetical protein
MHGLRTILLRVTLMVTLVGIDSAIVRNCTDVLENIAYGTVNDDPRGEVPTADIEKKTLDGLPRREGLRSLQDVPEDREAPTCLASGLRNGVSAGRRNASAVTGARCRIRAWACASRSSLDAANAAP